MDLQIIQNKIFEIRGYRVMLDFHLAELYGVQTKVLKQAVKRNEKRFPPDFRFTMTKEEWDELVTNCDQLPESLKHVVLYFNSGENEKRGDRTISPLFLCFELYLFYLFG